MAYTLEELRRIWKSTDGRCHLTGRPIKLKDYGKTWEVDHSKPRAKGGSNHGNNLKPATISANRSKQARSSRAARRAHGLPRSPMSPAEQERRRSQNTRTGVAIGAAVGALMTVAMGPMGRVVGGLIGGIIGGLIGHDAEVE